MHLTDSAQFCGPLGQPKHGGRVLVQPVPVNIAVDTSKTIN